MAERFDQIKLAVAAAAVIRAEMENIEEAIDHALARECVNGVASAAGTGFLCRDQFASHCHKASSNSGLGIGE